MNTAYLTFKPDNFLLLKKLRNIVLRIYKNPVNWLTVFLIFSFPLSANASKVVVWGAPDINFQPSADYQLTLKQSGITFSPFVYYTYNRSVDKQIDSKGLYLKNGFLDMHANEYIDPKLNKDTYAHSWSNFDFEGDSVEVEIIVSAGIEGITLPLTSCAVFPSSLGIKCKIADGNKIQFTLRNPAKIAVVPNYEEAQSKIANGSAAQAYAGYRNPFFLFARSPETNVPDKNAAGTLVVKSGAMYNQTDFDKSSVIYFEKGVHDYSRFVTQDTDNYMVLKSKQTVYLEGGAYVFGHFKASSKMLIADMPAIRGRGVLSGQKNIWTSIPYTTTEIKWVKTDGITVTDANNHLSHSVAPFTDVAVVGAWHGNTDGITVESGNSGETFSGYHVDNCFVMADDSNLKFRGTARIRNYTLWQLNNAEPLWIAESSNSTLDGLNIICHTAPARQHINMQVPAGSNMKNLLIKNILVESPYVGRLFLMQSNYTGAGVALDNVVFENITVNTKKIINKSPVGKVAAGNSAFGKLTFKNLVINGVKVTNSNYTDYFTPLNGLQIGTELVFE